MLEKFCRNLRRDSPQLLIFVDANCDDMIDNAVRKRLGHPARTSSPCSQVKSTQASAYMRWGHPRHLTYIIAAGPPNAQGMPCIHTTSPCNIGSTQAGQSYTLTHLRTYIVHTCTCHSWVRRTRLRSSMDRAGGGIMRRMMAHPNPLTEVEFLTSTFHTSSASFHIGIEAKVLLLFALIHSLQK